MPERTVITEYVKFLMPKSREYQMAAMAVVQQFVNGFDVRMRNNDLSQGKATYKLVYQLDMSSEDLAFFVATPMMRLRFRMPGTPRSSVGLDLRQMPVETMPDLTMLVDLSDERMEGFRETGKHAVAVCGLMCGILTPPLPEIRKVEISRAKPGIWWYHPTCDQLLDLNDYQITGIVGWRSVETYMAVSMGLGVVELDTEVTTPAWLTKWRSLVYRRIEAPLGTERAEQEQLIERAKLSIENTLGRIIELRQKALEPPPVFPGFKPEAGTGTTGTVLEGECSQEAADPGTESKQTEPTL